MPIMKSIPLTISLVKEVWGGISGPVYEEASAKITAKKNKTATAMAPNTAISFTKLWCYASRFKLNPCKQGIFGF